MATKTYGQMCPLARSLDVLGERWTLLLVREFLLGPRRFKYLLATFPSLGANRLSERLSSLEDAGVIHKVVLPEPASVTVYELTPHGEQLRGPVVALSLWGLALPMDERIDPATARGDLIALGLTATQTDLLDPARRESFQFDVGDEQLHLQLRDGRFLARSGPAPTSPELRVACDLQTFMTLALRGTTPSRATGDGHLTILTGTQDALDELFDVLVYEPPPAAAAAA